MFSKKNKRWRVLADGKLQGMLCARVAIYWVVCQFAMLGTIFGFSCLEGPASSTGPVTRFFIPALIISASVLPIALLDILVFSNRFAGPLLKFRRAFRELAANGTADEIWFRGGDYYTDLSDNFNKIRLNLHTERFSSFDDSKTSSNEAVTRELQSIE